MKLPALQFYPADWRKDPGVQSLTFAARGVWVEMLCLMHESPRRGVLLLPNGRAMSDDALARVIGAERRELAAALREILDNGVADREDETEAIVNRRMVRDQAKRAAAKTDGESGGSPRLKTGYSAPGFVYFARDPATNHFKIGIAMNVRNRIAKLRSMLGIKLEIEAVVATENMGEAEAEYHRIYSGKHVGGEWYALDENDIITLKGKAKGNGDLPLGEPGGEEVKGNAKGPLNPIPRASSSSSSSPSGNTPVAPKGGGKKAGELDREFEYFWAQVPTKIGRGAARRAWEKARGKATAAEIMAGLPGYAAYEARRRNLDGYQPLHPATWLNGERWTDTLPAPVKPDRNLGEAKSRDRVARVLEMLPRWRDWLQKNYEPSLAATQADPRTAREAVVQRFLDEIDREESAG